MIETYARDRIGWLAAAALAAVTVLCVGLAPAGLSPGSPTRAAAVEYCRAEVTRAFVVEHQAAGSRGFADCMATQGH